MEILFASIINGTSLPDWIKEIIRDHFSKITMSRIPSYVTNRLRFEYLDEVLYVDLIVDFVDLQIYKHYYVNIFDHKINLCVFDNLK